MTHDDIKHFKCEDCNKEYATIWGLNSHKKEHAANFKYVCDHCGKGFV